MAVLAPDLANAARDALDRGRAALTAGDKTEAERWLDRAHRLAPHDPGIALSLATACLGRDDARAETLFAEVAGQYDAREAWAGLAAARLHLDNHTGAADALHHALSRHAFWPRLRALADRIAHATQAAGWCGLSFDGTIHVQTKGAVAVTADGRAVGRRLTVGMAPVQTIVAQRGGTDLIGSPIDAAAIRRVEGVVEAVRGAVRGWAWHPAAPDTTPVLSLETAVGSARRPIHLSPEGIVQPGMSPLAYLHGFSIETTEPGPVHVRGADGSDLLGSPLVPGAETDGAIAAALHAAGGTLDRGAAFTPMLADAARPAKPIGRTHRRRRVDVVIPVHNGAGTTRTCLDSVLATVTKPSRVVVVDDASTDAALLDALRRMARTGRIVLIRNETNQGFPASANSGMAACGNRDVVLLNSDTLVPPGWLERLADAAYSAPDIGSVTPFTNAGSILSYPSLSEDNPCPDAAHLAGLDRLARRANRVTTIDIPVGVGFCLYVRRDCLNATGMFRADVFAQGYGEENDFCLRATHLGWRHVALPGVFVAHVGGASFGMAAQHLRRRNAAILERLHPGHDRLISDFITRDPLADARRRLDLARWRRQPGESVILITHDDGGGVETRCAAEVAAHRAAGRRAIVLRPARAPDGQEAVIVGDGVQNAFPNLRYRLPTELPALTRFLRQQNPVGIEIHHLLDHAPSVHALIERLGCPYEVHVHDYAWFCPRIALVNGSNRYCGEPDQAACEACVEDHGRLIHEEISVAALRERSGRLLAAASRVVAPSDDAAVRIKRHFPRLNASVVWHEDDVVTGNHPPPPQGERARICVVGAIGVQKGFDVLLACARDAAARDLPLDFVLVGRSIDDERLLNTGRVFVTGGYEQADVVELIRRQNAGLGWVPSIWPETWCMTLSEIWQSGLSAVAFDIGAPAERIRRTGRGFVLPLGLSPKAINKLLMDRVSSP